MTTTIKAEAGSGRPRVAGVATRRSFKAALVVGTVLEVFDVVGLTGLASDDAPPAAVLIIGTVLGLTTLIASVGPGVVARVPRVAVASRGIPALGVPGSVTDDAPDSASGVVAVGLTLAGLR